MDEIDHAQIYNDHFLSVAIAAARGRAVRSESESRLYCEDCGMQIPEARREAIPGCIWCVGCQEIFESGS